MSRTILVPSVQLKLEGDQLAYGNVTDLSDQPANTTGIAVPYINITISNSINSLQNVTITRLTIDVGNKTYEIDNTLTYPKLSTSGYVLHNGETITIICIWDYTQIGSNPVTITVYTAEGIQTSRTWEPAT